MDRQSFLSSMPFLLPCPSAAWPPRRTAGNAQQQQQQQQATKMDLLLDTQQQKSYKFKLSVEPAIATTADASGDDGGISQALTEIQPAFFGRPVVEEDGNNNNNNNCNHDPAMTDILVAVESSTSFAEGEAPVSHSQDDPSVLEARVLFAGETNNNTNNNGETSSGSRTQTPSSNKNSPRSMPQNETAQTMQNHGHFPESWPLVLYFKMEGAVYQVDGKQLLQMAVVQPGHTATQKEGDGEKDDDNKSSSISPLPPCLILVFPCCLFRIFPLQTPSPTTLANSASDSDATQLQVCYGDALQKMKMLETLLGQLVSSAPATMAAAWSPSSGSFPNSSNEEGQKEYGDYHRGGVGQQQQQQSHSHSTLTSSSSSLSAGSRKKLKAMALKKDSYANSKATLEDNHIIRKIKRRRDALVRSRAGLQAVETILDMPLSVYDPDALLPSLTGGRAKMAMAAPAITAMTDSAVSECAMPKTQVQGHFPQNNNTQSNTTGGGTASANVWSMGPLLAGITEDMTDAYGSSGETHEAMQLYQGEIDDIRESRMDDLMDAFFPSMPQRHCGSSKKKGRRNSKGSLRGGKTNDSSKKSDAKSMPVDEAIESVHRLIQQQRSLVQERSSLLQLPTRG